MIYVTGDIHADIDIGKLSMDKFPQQRDLSKSDYLIICGDFGLVWDGLVEKYAKSHRVSIIWNEVRFSPSTERSFSSWEGRHHMINTTGKNTFHGGKRRCRPERKWRRLLGH